jgi:ribosomal protein S28E/S33
MPERSATALLGILQRHGVTREVLEVWVHFCEARKTGVVTYHHVHGKVEMVEVSHKSRVSAAENGLDKDGAH